MRSNQNLRVFWKPVNPQDCVWENLYRIIMKTILQERWTIHCNITIWYTNYFPCLKPWKFLQRKQWWTRNGKNWRNFGRGTWQKSEVRKKRSMKQGRRAQKFISPHWWTQVIWKMPNRRQNTKNTKVELYSEVILWKMILDLMQYSLNKVHQHHEGSSKSHGLHIQAAWLCRTSSCFYPGQNGRCSQIIENSKIGVSRHLDSSTTTQMAKIMVQYGRPSRFLLSDICMVILWQDHYGKGNLRNSYWNMDGRKFQIGNAYSYTVTKMFFLSVYVDDIKLAGKTQNIILFRCGKYSTKKSIWENQHLSLIMKTWDVLKDNVK